VSDEHGIEETLSALRRSGLHRRMRVVEQRVGTHVVIDGEPVLLLCSNDYLGLANHPVVMQAATDATARWGAGAGASRLVSGNLALHAALERELASFKGTESAVLFGSGYLANVGVVSTLAQPGGVVLSDRLNHASIVDGCRLARAETIVYEHCDLDSLAAALDAAGDRPKLIVTESVFSMDGDIAPLAGIVELAERHGARVVVDEAHATGVVGPGGHGLVAMLGLARRVDAVVGTLGKALGSYGAFACCSALTAEYLVNTARTLIFSTGLPPAAVGAALASVRLIRDEPSRVERLRRNGRVLRKELAAAGWDVASDDTPIVPIVVGAPDEALLLAGALLEGGVFAQAIRPPTVPAGTSRLRLTASAAHDEAQLRDAVAVLVAAADGLELLPQKNPDFTTGDEPSVRTRAGAGVFERRANSDLFR
jgi:8-amino-7-oxononanoate synthase